METLSIRLLGTVDIRLGEQPVQGFVSSKAQALFFYLAVTRRPVPRATLATLFWGDWDERSARRSLSKALSNLRQLLGQYLQIDRHTAAFRMEQIHWLDVAAFEAALRRLSSPTQPPANTATIQNALALYQGKFLEGFTIVDAPDFEAWARNERDRLHRACCNALSALIHHAGQDHDLHQAINLTQQLLQLEPADEQAHRRLMMLYVYNGQRSKALAQYTICRKILAEELDVEPADETIALYQAIREGSFALDDGIGQTDTSAPAGHVAPHMLPPAFPHKTNNAPLLSTFPAPPASPLVGRAVPWQQLLSLWQQTVAGRTHVCLIHGEAGIGKTRLAEELLYWAAGQGATTVRTRTYAAAGELAYAPIIDWLRSPPLQETVATLDVVWRTRIARLLPELTSASIVGGAEAETTAQEQATGPNDSQWQRQRLFDALTQAFHAGKAPKLLLLDDLQWCDRETLAWLNYFLQASRATTQKSQSIAPALIVATARPEILHEAHPLMPVLLHLRSEDAITELNLAPLDDVATAALAAQLSSHQLSADQSRALYHYTEGNPLFVMETLRTGPWQANLHNAAPLPRSTDEPPFPAGTARKPDLAQPLLPTKVQAVIQERLASLSPLAYRLAGLASVIGRSFDLTLLQQASIETEQQIIDGLDELWQQGIVRTHGPQRYDFSHDRIREVAYLTVGPVQRPQWHRQVAQALEMLYAQDLTPVSAQLAFHYEEVGETERAIEYYRRAAERACRLFANGDAVDLLFHALALIETLPHTAQNKRIELALLVALRDPLTIAQGHFEPALGIVGMRAKVLAEELGETSQLVQALQSLFLFHQMRAEYTESRAMAETILQIVAKEDIEDIGEYYSPLANVCLYLGEFVSAQVQFDRHLSSAVVPAPPSLFAAMNLWFMGYPAQAQHRVDQVRKKVHSERQPHLMAHLAINRARLYHFMRDLREMKRFTEEALVLDGTYNSPTFLVLAKLFQGRILAEEGKYARGITQIQAMLAQLDEKRHAAFRTHFLGLLAEAYACAGQFAEALEVLQQALGFVERNGEGVWHAELVRLQGEYRLTLGASPREVVTCYEEAITIAQAQQAKSLELRATMSLARLWQQQGQHEAALARLTEIYNWFTEGFNTADLRDARVLLAELTQMSQRDG